MAQKDVGARKQTVRDGENELEARLQELEASANSGQSAGFDDDDEYDPVTQSLTDLEVQQAQQAAHDTQATAALTTPIAALPDIVTYDVEKILDKKVPARRPPARHRRCCPPL